MKYNKIQFKTKMLYKKREQLFLFRKLTDISKQNVIVLIIIVIQFNSFHLFTCLTTARKGQLQPSTKTTVQDKI
jgi:hypothetical protein